MHSIGSSVKRGGVFAGVVLTGLLLVATACGGGSKSSSSSDSNGSTATTASSSSGGSSSGGSGTAGLSASCLDLAKKFEDAAAKIESSTNSTTGDTDWKSLVSTLDGMTSSMPSKVQGDWKIYVDAIKKIGEAMNGVNMSTLMSDPAAMQKFTDSMSALNDPKIETALNNIEAYFNQKCPGM